VRLIGGGLVLACGIYIKSSKILGDINLDIAIEEKDLGVIVRDGNNWYHIAICDAK